MSSESPKECSHGNWVCQPKTDHHGQEVCQAQELWDDMHRGDPTAGVVSTVEREIALGKVQLTTSKRPDVSVAIDTSSGDLVTTEQVAIPDGFDEFNGGRSVYGSGFIGSKRRNHVIDGDTDD